MTPTNLRALAEKATPGERKAIPMGGYSMVTISVAPNGRHWPAVAYDASRTYGYSIALPFWHDDNGPHEYRDDFVEFTHEDAAFIARCDPQTILALLTRAETAEADAKTAGEHADQCEAAMKLCEADNARVREALRPLARLAELIDRDHPTWTDWPLRRPDDAVLVGVDANRQGPDDLTMGHARAALAAIRKGEPPDGLV